MYMAGRTGSDLGYLCSPQHLFRYVGGGTRLVGRVHGWIHDLHVREAEVGDSSRQKPFSRKNVILFPTPRNPYSRVEYNSQALRLIE